MSFFEELKRRNVVRVGVAYGIAAWVLLQVADLVLEAIEAPTWVLKALMLVVLLGFVAALVIAWAYEITPEGIKKESDIDRTQSIVGNTGKKLDRIIIGFLQAQGIQAIILEDDAGDQFPSLEETQGVKILVPDQDLETAQSLLAEREEAAANDKSGEEE